MESACVLRDVHKVHQTIKNIKPSLNTQADSIRTKRFT